MPEGPEVRRYADALSLALTDKPIISITTRMRVASAWLSQHPNILISQRIKSVRSRGKHIISLIEGGYYFHSHLMMWGRWQIIDSEQPQFQDSRERVRIVVPGATAILSSAPVFQIGTGDPFEQVENLRTLGVEVLPYPEEPPFETLAFRKRLLTSENSDRAIGVALLDQQIVAGIGNYLRAEILFDCRIDPWRRVADLTEDELKCLEISIPQMVQRAYLSGGFTVSDDMRSRLETDVTLVYRLGSLFGTRHYVFRRTNLPCLVCGTKIRQMQQVTRTDLDVDKSRIIYFCPQCQNTKLDLEKTKKKRSPAADKQNN